MDNATSASLRKSFKRVFKVHSLALGRVLLQQRSAETVYRHLHHPAQQEMINGGFCPLIVFLESKTNQLNFELCD